MPNRLELSALEDVSFEPDEFRSGVVLNGRSIFPVGEFDIPVNFSPSFVTKTQAVLENETPEESAAKNNWALGGGFDANPGEISHQTLQLIEDLGRVATGPTK